MGKNGKFGKDYGKVVGKDDKGRPGWKGPGYVKKQERVTPAKKKDDEEPNDQTLEPTMPVELQQLLLNIFKNAFPETLGSEALQQQLQDVKAALYDRDFGRAFGSPTYLEVYSVRWSPSRALCYAAILIDLRKHVAEISPSCASGPPKNAPEELVQSSPSFPAKVPRSPLHALCFGGGSAEVVAFGGFLRYLEVALPSSSSDPTEKLNDLSISDSSSPEMDLILIDSAPWQHVMYTLYQGLITPPPLSKYASLSAKEANSSLLEPGSVAVSFHAEDILALSQSQLDLMVGKRQMLVTLLFTLNELYTTSIGKTTEFLLKLTASVQPGTLLLVVDSPGSYSETTIGTEAKKYPMLWLLNHTLLDTEKSRGQESAASWVKVVSEESQWFRLHENLRFPIGLENMRYQLHLYRRV